MDTPEIQYINNTTAKSPYWKHFGYPIIDGEVDKMLGVCKICKVKVRHSKNTTNLRNHLEKWHPELVYDRRNGEEDSTRRRPVSTVRPPYNATQDTRLTYKTDQIYRKIARFLIAGLHPPSMVEEPAFVSMLQSVSVLRGCENRFHVPPEIFFSQQLIPQMFQETLQGARMEVALARKVCISMELWRTLHSSHAHATITAHFITPDWSIRSILLDTILVGSRSEKLASDIGRVLNEWNLPKRNITSAVTVKSDVLSASLKLVGCNPVLECLKETINHVGHVMINVPAIKELIEIANNLVNFLNSHPVAQSVFEDKLNFDSCGSGSYSHGMEDWFKHYSILQGISSQYQSISTVLQDPEIKADIAMNNIKVITDDQYRTLKRLVSLIQHLEDATLSLEEEVHLSVSCVLPIVKTILDSTTQSSDDCENLCNVKKIIYETLNISDSELKNHLLMASFLDPRFLCLTFVTPEERKSCLELTVAAVEALCSTDDHGMGLAQSRDMNVIKQEPMDIPDSSTLPQDTNDSESEPPIKIIKLEPSDEASIQKDEDLEFIIRESPNNTDDDKQFDNLCGVKEELVTDIVISEVRHRGQASLKSDPPGRLSSMNSNHPRGLSPLNCDRPRGLSRLFGEASSKGSFLALSLHARAHMEVMKYSAEETCRLTSDPLHWWRDREAMYPLLSTLAQQILCVPATSTSLHRHEPSINLTTRTIPQSEHIKHTKLSNSQQLRTMLFLRHNVTE